MKSNASAYRGAVSHVSTITSLEPGTIYDRVWQPHIQHWGGEHLLATWGHHLTGKMDMGDIQCAVSRDGGQSWLPPVTVFDHRERFGGIRFAYANSVLYRAPGQDIIWCYAIRCPLHYCDSEDSQLCAAYTADGGWSWTPVEVANHVHSALMTTAAPIKVGDRYLLPLGRNTIRHDPHGDARTFVLESTDLISWKLAGFVPFDLENPVLLCEAGIARTDESTLTMVMRTGIYGHKKWGPLEPPRAYSSQSTDGGRTWSQAKPETKLFNASSKGFYSKDSRGCEIYIYNSCRERKALHYCLRRPGEDWSEPAPFYDDGHLNSYATLVEQPDNPGVHWCVWDGSDSPDRKRTAIRFGILDLTGNARTRE